VNALPVRYWLCPGCDRLRPIEDAKKIVRHGREVVLCKQCCDGMA
jgi:hypothetical protein